MLTSLKFYDKIIIPLDRVYNSGEKFSIDISYNGSPKDSNPESFGSFIFGTHNENPIIWTLSQPYGTKEWWPSKDSPADKADSSEVWVRSDDFFVTVSNGILLEEVNHGDGTNGTRCGYRTHRGGIELHAFGNHGYAEDLACQPG